MAKKKRAESAPPPADASEAPGRETVHTAWKDGVESTPDGPTTTVQAGEPPVPEPTQGTAQMPVGVPEPEPSPDHTLRMPTGPRPDAPEEAGPGSTLALPILDRVAPPERTYATRQVPENQLPGGSGGRKGRWIALGGLGLLLTVGGGILLMRPDLLDVRRDAEPSVEVPPEPAPAAAPVPAPVQEPTVEVPPALRSYHEKALKGDANAMAVLGTMYYNGLNVPPNREEGLKWLRKAAAAGNAAARKQLDNIERPAPAQP